ncbi:MAG: hypothetical protein N4A38_05600 [Candidatus Gracilibacteria bacterium]|nr:hypothetical protein [Candidatus Gracilibacteria bacterium]
MVNVREDSDDGVGLHIKVAVSEGAGVLREDFSGRFASALEEDFEPEYTVISSDAEPSGEYDITVGQILSCDYVVEEEDVTENLKDRINIEEINDGSLISGIYFSIMNGSLENGMHTEDEFIDRVICDGMDTKSEEEFDFYRKIYRNTLHNMASKGYIIFDSQGKLYFNFKFGNNN